MYDWFIVVAAYIVSVVLMVIALRIANIEAKTQPTKSEIIFSIVPLLNSIFLILFIVAIVADWFKDGEFPKWIIKLYGGR